MSNTSVGEFEEIILLVVAILNGGAYSVNIIDEIDERLNRSVSLGAVQTVLKRLEKKGLLKSAFGETTKERGGKRKRLYEITNDGLEVLEQNKIQRDLLWDAIPKVVLKLI